MFYKKQTNDRKVLAVLGKTRVLSAVTWGKKEFYII